MRQHLINLDYLAAAANLLVGPQGALQLAVIYATIEKVCHKEYARGAHEFRDIGFEEGYTAGTLDERTSLRDDATFDPSDYTPVDDVITLNEEAHGHHDEAPVDLRETHYDLWCGRFHRSGEAE